VRGKAMSCNSRSYRFAINLIVSRYSKLPPQSIYSVGQSIIFKDTRETGTFCECSQREIQSSKTGDD
jgi:hypothetical protein